MPVSNDDTIATKRRLRFKNILLVYTLIKGVLKMIVNELRRFSRRNYAVNIDEPSQRSNGWYTQTPGSEGTGQ